MLLIWRIARDIEVVVKELSSETWAGDVFKLTAHVAEAWANKTKGNRRDSCQSDSR